MEDIVDEFQQRITAFVFSKLTIRGSVKWTAERHAKLSLIDHDSLSNRLGSSLVGIPISTLLALVHVRPKLRARVFLAGRFGTLLSLRMEAATTSRISQPLRNMEEGTPQSIAMPSNTGRSLVSPIGHYLKLTSYSLSFKLII